MTKMYNSSQITNRDVWWAVFMDLLLLVCYCGFGHVCLVLRCVCVVLCVDGLVFSLARHNKASAYRFWDWDVWCCANGYGWDGWTIDRCCSINCRVWKVFGLFVVVDGCCEKERHGGCWWGLVHCYIVFLSLCLCVFLWLFLFIYSTMWL